MTEKTQPTNAELDMLIDDVAGLDSSNETFRKFARAVLARWGQPAHSGVQALSAAPAIGDELRDTLVAVSAAIAERDDRAAQKMICEILATPPAEQQAQPGAVYAELPEPDATTVGLGAVWNRHSMRDFADATCALRATPAQFARGFEDAKAQFASHGQAPAGAGMGHTDGGRNMFYEGRFDGESKREQQARLRWANDMRAAFERHTGNGWFDKDWRTETGLWSSAWHACLAAQPTTMAQAAPAYKDSTPEMHVGDSAFESWYSTYNPAHKSDKQRAHDAYAAGMGDPLVTAAPAAVAGPVAFTAEHVTYIRRYGGSCRDCADENGVCPNRGLPCADSEKAIRFVLEALAYGINHGYIAAPTTQPSPAAQGDALDAARLDWLELAGPVSICLVIDREHDGDVEVSADGATGYGKTLRAAIDAARTAQEGK